MTAEIGRVLGGRYRLVAPIGMGASAQVYLADDVKLRRRVALKMLHDALAGDSEFLRRFRAEARAAAALSHPNVMAVYDWGDGEVAFIVTEYLPGGSLRSLLDAGNQLSPAQALGLGLEAARALDYAHRRGFVHRDIKPANLLFGEEQRLRIADFGLARALAEAAWTEPQGAMLGTARYASPEQAKGEKLSGKADVYSLALVLVEAVSGDVPFVADTTLGTLMARVDRQLEVPDSLGPLQQVLARAGHPDPEQRIDARGLATGLLRAAKVLSRPAPLPLVGALSPLNELAIDPDPTIHAPGPVLAPAVAGSVIAKASDMTADDLELGPPDWVNQARGAATLVDEPDAGPDGDASGAGPGGHDADHDVDDDDTPEAKAKADGDAADVGADDDDHDHDDHDDQDLTVVGAMAGAGVVVDELDLTEAAVASPSWADSPPPGHDAADRVVDPKAARAAQAGIATAAVPAVVPPRSPVAVLDPVDGEDGGGDDYDDGHRRRRWPWVVLVLVLLLGGGGVAAAAVANRDTPSATVRPIALPVPSLTDRTEQQATAIAEAAGWKVVPRRIRQNGTHKGQVLASKPAAGSRLAEGRTLELVVSLGQKIVAVPDGLVGKTEADAKSALGAVGLEGTVSSTTFDEDKAKGTVVSLKDGTKPKLEKGSTVGLVLSDGPKPRTVPSDLRGSTEAEAKAALDAVQLKMATTSSYSDSVPEGHIISVLPKGGTSVPRGSTVTVEVSKGPALVAVPSIKGAKSLGQAILILKQSGLRSGSVSGPADGKPKSTSPGAGTMVHKGSTVDIVLG
jgi:beta-lactam-binding protein with PASTA domain/tRNA A-37 threonylcarbamoyl transferase component Bud32